jgi:hypothetical protein
MSALLLTLAACSSSSAAYAPPMTGAAQQTARSGYRVLGYTYRVMPLRTSTLRSAVSAGTIIYPDDLTNYGGPIMRSEAAHDIYVNCPAKNQSCWGAPEAFQSKLTGSSFAALLRQYSKTGYANLYHVFLPNGTDTCFDFTTECYSPNSPSAFYFCAYHGSVSYSDIGRVVYSIEPYQNVKGCLTKGSSGASQLTNSTISTLAHETFESITDPGARFAWFNFDDDEEMADEWETFVVAVTPGGTVSNTQPMYSNIYHGCAVSP